MSNWKDITSHSRGDDGKPHWWELSVGAFRISVGNNHIYFPDGKTWLLHCSPWYDTKSLQSKDELSAKSEAIALVRQRLQEAAKLLEGL